MFVAMMLYTARSTQLNSNIYVCLFCRSALLLPFCLMCRHQSSITMHPASVAKQLMDSFMFRVSSKEEK